MKVSTHEKQARINLQGFIQNLLDENFAAANQSLQEAVREKLKARVEKTLKEND